jgi:hypothetical protein
MGTIILESYALSHYFRKNETYVGIYLFISM